MISDKFVKETSITTMEYMCQSGLDTDATDTEDDSGIAEEMEDPSHEGAEGGCNDDDEEDSKTVSIADYPDIRIGDTVIDIQSNALNSFFDYW